MSQSCRGFSSQDNLNFLKLLFCSDCLGEKAPKAQYIQETSKDKYLSPRSQLPNTIRLPKHRESPVTFHVIHGRRIVSQNEAALFTRIDQQHFNRAV